MVNIFNGARSIIGDERIINSVLIINKNNNISLMVESLNKKASQIQENKDYLSLDLISIKEKQLLSGDENFNFSNYYIRRMLDHDEFDAIVQNRLNKAINDKKSRNVTFNPIAIYDTLINRLKSTRRTKKPINLKLFNEDVDKIIETQTEKFNNYADVQDCNDYSKEFNRSKLLHYYSNIRSNINAEDESSIYTIRFYITKSNMGIGEKFDDIIERLKLFKEFNFSDVEEIMAYILLVIGEK